MMNVHGRTSTEMDQFAINGICVLIHFQIRWEKNFDENSNTFSHNWKFSNLLVTKWVMLATDVASRSNMSATSSICWRQIWLFCHQHFLLSTSSTNTQKCHQNIVYVTIFLDLKRNPNSRKISRLMKIWFYNMMITISWRKLDNRSLHLFKLVANQGATLQTLVNDLIWPRFRPDSVLKIFTSRFWP